MNLRTGRLALSSGLATVLAVAAAAVLAACGSASKPEHARKKTTAPGELTATVSASGQVTLTSPSGAAVARLPSGRYTLQVTVNSSTADFNLTGPALHQATTPHFVGIALWGVDFVNGTYHYGNDSSASGRAATHAFTVY